MFSYPSFLIQRTMKVKLGTQWKLINLTVYSYLERYRQPNQPVKLKRDDDTVFRLKGPLRQYFSLQ